MLCPSDAQLIAQHLDLVPLVARKLARTLSDRADLEDMIGDGMLGLIAAARSYDPARKVKFKTYASQRIRGAILDGLRAQMPQSRNSNHRWAVVESCRAEFFAEHGRRPCERELIKLLRDRGIRAKAARRYLLWANTHAQTESIAKVVYDGDKCRPLSFGDLLADRDALDPCDAVATPDLLAAMTAGFSRQETLAFLLYFVAGSSLREAGQAIGLSESRISQIVGGLLDRVRAQDHLADLAGGRGPEQLSATQIRLAVFGDRAKSKVRDRCKDGRSPDRQGCRRTDADGRSPVMEPGVPTQDGKRRATTLPNPSRRPSCRRKETIQIQRSVA